LLRRIVTGVIWPNGKETPVDAVIWCTGYSPALDYLQPLGIVEPGGKVASAGTRALKRSELWMVGYGNWTGFASTTLIGVGRSARETVSEIERYVRDCLTFSS
jgi:hypothetical protein